MAVVLSPVHSAFLCRISTALELLGGWCATPHSFIRSSPRPAPAAPTVDPKVVLPTATLAPATPAATSRGQANDPMEAVAEETPPPPSGPPEPEREAEAVPDRVVPLSMTITLDPLLLDAVSACFAQISRAHIE